MLFFFSSRFSLRSIPSASRCFLVAIPLCLHFLPTIQSFHAKYDRRNRPYGVIYRQSPLYFPHTSRPWCLDRLLERLPRRPPLYEDIAPIALIFPKFLAILWEGHQVLPFLFSVCEFLGCSQAVRQWVFTPSDDGAGPMILGSPCHSTWRPVGPVVSNDVVTGRILPLLYFPVCSTYIFFFSTTNNFILAIQAI